MKRRRLTTVFTLTALLTCATLSTGCNPLNWIGPNLTIGITIPLGLGGNPGIFNPFGIVQALVNSLLGQTVGAAGQQVSTVPPRPLTGGLGGIVSILN